MGECEHRRVIPYPTPNTWAVPKRWLICTKDNIGSNLPEEPAHSRPSSHPNTCRRLSSSRSTWCSTLGTVFTLCRAPSRTDRSTRVSTAAGCQTGITPRGYMNRGLAPRTHLFPHLVCCLSHVGTTIYIAESERAHMSHRAELLSAHRSATDKSCLYNHLVYHRLEIPIWYEETVAETSALSCPRARSAVGISTLTKNLMVMTTVV